MVCDIRMFDHFYVPCFAHKLNLAVGDVFKLESIHTETEEADLENHLNSSTVEVACLSRAICTLKRTAPYRTVLKRTVPYRTVPERT